jgi:hypothetical protein
VKKEKFQPSWNRFEPVLKMNANWKTVSNHPCAPSPKEMSEFRQNFVLGSTPEFAGTI